MFESINRDVLILFPKQPLYDWANSVYPDDKMECPKPLTHDEGDVFLIPEYSHPGEAREYVRENFIHFFEEELFDWVTDETLWPEKLTWEMFESRFHYCIQSVVKDSLDEEIIKEDL